MRCERCRGLTVCRPFSGGTGTADAWDYVGWQCVNCGHITDPLIERNRAGHVRRTGRQFRALRSDRRTEAAASISA